jgi:hypothetical protein
LLIFPFSWLVVCAISTLHAAPAGSSINSSVKSTPITYIKTANAAEELMPRSRHHVHHRGHLQHPIKRYDSKNDDHHLKARYHSSHHQHHDKLAMHKAGDHELINNIKLMK